MSNLYQNQIALGLKSYNFVLCNIEIYPCPFLPDRYTALFSKTGSHFLGGPTWRSPAGKAQCLKSAKPSHLPTPQDSTIKTLVSTWAKEYWFFPAFRCSLRLELYHLCCYHSYLSSGKVGETRDSSGTFCIGQVWLDNL